ncbi:MAG: ATP-binding protein [Kiritimatiellae bacterium]|nr:ATP-binding protein [Kiritimatiellia bacterium]
MTTPSKENHFEPRFQRLKAQSLMRMAGGMAHDFNNFLAAIQGNNELILAQCADDTPYLKSVHQIQSLSEASLGLTQRIQIFAGQTYLEPKRLVPEAFLQQQMAALQSLAKGQVRVSVTPIAPCPAIHVDEKLLTLSLANLVINATEALADLPGVINVSCGVISRTDESVPNIHNVDLHADQYVYFEVSDSGPGMADEVTFNAFDPFFTTKIRAEGMGLPVVLGVAWAHQGAVQLDSSPGKGTRLRLLLPACDTAAE